MYQSTREQADDLLAYLDEHNPSISEIEHHLASHYDRPVGAHHLISLARYHYGDDIVIGEWTGRWDFRYRTARSASESRIYVARRARIARNTTDNIVRMVDRTITKFPGEDPALMATIRANLIGAITLLDSTL